MSKNLIPTEDEMKLMLAKAAKLDELKALTDHQLFAAAIYEVGKLKDSPLYNKTDARNDG